MNVKIDKDLCLTLEVGSVLCKLALWLEFHVTYITIYLINFKYKFMIKMFKVNV